MAQHDRCWDYQRTITDPAHQVTAKQLRADLAGQREERRAQRLARAHADGHVVAIRALPDYDALFGVDFDPRPDPHCNTEAVTADSTAEGM